MDHPIHGHDHDLHPLQPFHQGHIAALYFHLFHLDMLPLSLASVPAQDFYLAEAADYSALAEYYQQADSLAFVHSAVGPKTNFKTSLLASSNW